MTESAQSAENDAVVERAADALRTSRLSWGTHGDRWGDVEWQREFWTEAATIALTAAGVIPALGDTPSGDVSTESGATPLTIERKLDLIAAEPGWQFMFDDCHKIYVVRDEADLFRMKESGWDDDDLRPMAELRAAWERSCFLRFVSMGNLQPHPWTIEQGAEDEGDEQQEDV